MRQRRRLTNVGFGVAILLLSGVGWYARNSSIQARDAARWVSHTYQVRETLHSVLSALHDAERAQRGYVLRSDEPSLEPYTRSARQAVQHLRELDQLTRDNPAQQERIKLVTDLTTRRLASLDRTLNVRRTHGLDSALALIMSGRGQLLMDSARSAIADMQAREQDLLRIRSERSEADGRTAQLVIVLGSGLGILLLATSAVLTDREIRARLAAKERLRQNEELIQLLVTNAKDHAILMLDPGGHVVSWNQGAEALKGYRVEEILGKPHSVFYTEEDRKRGHPQQMLQRAIAEGRSQEDGWRVRKDGSRFWANVVITALRDENGELRGFGKLTRDFTERKKAQELLASVNEQLEARVAERTEELECLNEELRVENDERIKVEAELRGQEEKLRETADQLQALVRAAPVAIVGIDLNGNVSSWHGGAPRMFGWSAEEIVGRPLAIIPPEKEEEFRALRSRVRQGDSIVGLDTHRVRKDGSRIDVSVSYAPLHDRTGQIVGATIVYEDITERRLVAEQRRARESAEAANRAKSNFLANMSHELRTPLNAIIGFSELLQDQTFGTLNEKQQRYVANVHTSGRHLLQLVNDILDLAKVEAGRLTLEPEPLSLKPMLDEMQRGLEPLAIAKRQTLVIEATDDLPKLVADRGKLKQILYNLLSNAIKFTKEGGRVGVRVTTVHPEQGQPQIQIAVWDTGIGIAPEDIKRVFLEFEQLDSSYVREQEGTGLGLALTKQLVEAHGGRIWVESTVGQGSTFTFVLPVAAAGVPAPVHVSAPSRPHGHPHQPPLVLVVEDDTTGRELLAHYLTENGYAVAYAGTGAEALDLARRLKPAAISLDILLPDMDGLQVLSRLRGDPETGDIPVIVVSITDDRERGLSAGAAAWLVKPVQRQQFIEALDRVMPSGSSEGNQLALVVDDDPEAVELASDILRQRGFEVLQAFGGSEGLTIALERLPSLVILDLSMPGVSGFTVAQQLRADPRTRRTPILVLTALDLSAGERADLLRHVQTIVPKSGAETILEALQRLGLTGNREVTANGGSGSR